MKRRLINQVQIIDEIDICAMFFLAFARRYGVEKIVAIHEDEGIEILGTKGKLYELGGWHTFGTIIG